MEKGMSIIFLRKHRALNWLKDCAFAYQTESMGYLIKARLEPQKVRECFQADGIPRIFWRLDRESGYALLKSLSFRQMEKSLLCYRFRSYRSYRKAYYLSLIRQRMDNEKHFFSKEKYRFLKKAYMLSQKGYLKLLEKSKDAKDFYLLLKENYLKILGDAITSASES